LNQEFYIGDANKYITTSFSIYYFQSYYLLMSSPTVVSYWKLSPIRRDRQRSHGALFKVREIASRES